MITLTMPEWFTWLLVLLIVLQALNTCLRTYLAYLNRKLLKHTGAPR